MSDKPLGGKAYGSIPHLSTSKLTQQADKKISVGQETILTQKTRDRNDIIVVQEKLDGSCVCAANIGGDIIPLGRGGYPAESSPYEQHRYFAAWAIKNSDRFRDMLVPGERACGEWMMQAHGTLYNLTCEPFVLFDIFDHDDKRITYMDLLERAHSAAFVTPRLISYGQPCSTEYVQKQIKVSGHGAIEPVEGAVWRCERNNAVDFLAKWVRSDKVDGKYLDEVRWNVGAFDYL